MKAKLIFLIILSLSAISCNKIAKNLKNMADPKVEKVNEKAKEGLVKKYYPGGKLRAEIYYSKGRKHGTAKEYYRNGNLKLVVNYKNGIKDGPSSFYYENGKLYRETPFAKGKIEGTRKIYSNGKLIAEIPYKNGNPGAGLKEFYISGKLKKGFPVLAIKPADKRLINNTYLLEVNFSQVNPRDEFYIGELLDGKFIHSGLKPIETKNGVGKVTLEVPPGAFLMQKINFVGIHYTSTGSPYITSKTYNLAIE